MGQREAEWRHIGRLGTLECSGLYALRSRCLTPLLPCMLQTQEVHEVTHYHYHRWPVFGVPDSTEPIRKLIKLLYKTRRERETTVVHCRCAALALMRMSTVPFPGLFLYGTA